MLVSNERPSDSSTIRPNRKGVMSLPLMPRVSHSASACPISPSMSARAISSASGTGLATTIPPSSPRAHLAAIIAASVSTSSARNGARWSLVRE
jgi:hypothetical protein